MIELLVSQSKILFHPSHPLPGPTHLAFRPDLFPLPMYFPAPVLPKRGRNQQVPGSPSMIRALPHYLRASPYSTDPPEPLPPQQ